MGKGNIEVRDALTYQTEGGERGEKVGGKSSVRLHFSTDVGHHSAPRALAINTHDAG